MTTRPESSMTLGEHLEDLRKRLIFALLGLLPLVALAFVFGKRLLFIILKPAEDALRQGDQPDLTALSPVETFSSYMRVSVLAAIVVGSPWIFYQLWKFVSPGLHRHERRFVYFLVPLSGLLTAGGVYFLFKIVVPLILSFLIAFGTGLGKNEPPTAPLPDGVTLPTLPLLEADPDRPQPGQAWVNTKAHKLRIAMPGKDDVVQVLSLDMYKDAGIRQQYRVNEVLSMMLTLILAFAGAFQAPLIVLLLGWAGVVDRAFLAKYRRHAVLVCAIIAAAVMPGDPASMAAMMIPLYLLYELGGILLWLFPAHRVAGKPAPMPEPTGPTTEDADDRP